MLDVHAPHQSVHSWRDFFVHIATIAVGLLIAVGLEQTVEAIRHHQERLHLIADMQNEARQNRDSAQQALNNYSAERPGCETPLSPSDRPPPATACST